MTTRAILAEDHTIAFDCPKCRLRTKVALDQIGHTYHCKVKCSCGNLFTAEIEFRERSRKQLDLPGDYEIVGQPATGLETPLRGACRVIDISRSGLAFLLSSGRQPKPGETLSVRFRLDNAEATEIIQECEVRHVRENFVGCRLRGENGALEDYLLG
jgi:hypothetical protein